MTKKCFRCGKCCDNYFGIVPKTKKDDLSPRFLVKMGFDDSQEHVENHSELMGHPCKWLMHTKNGLTKCKVYSHRSSDCRNYPEGEGDCRVGKFMEVRAGCDTDSHDYGIPPTLKMWVSCLRFYEQEALF